MDLIFPPMAEGFFVSAQRAVIFANGELKDPEFVLSTIREDDYIVAVDGGLKHVFLLGLIPHILIGDLDSVLNENLVRLEKEDCDIIRFQPEKDETDLELAIQLVINKGFHNICVVSALGGRLDHSLGNLLMLTRPDLAEFNVRLEDGEIEAFLIRSRGQIKGKPGDVVSLLPITQSVKGVCTQGLLYPLREETLLRMQTRGISNEMLGDEAEVQITDGQLLCFHSHAAISELP